jgi:glutathione S-transferase
MRPWLALRANNIAFEEVFIPLYTGKADKDRLLSVSRSGKVPALIDGDVTVWDSLSIIEYLAEKFPEAGLWPDDRTARAHARSISAEMHSGFMPLRNECGMNLHRPIRAVALSDDAQANVARVQEIWADCHARYGKKGPFCLAPSPAPTRCSRRSCIASAPLRFQLRRMRSLIWMR